MNQEQSQIEPPNSNKDFVAYSIQRDLIKKSGEEPMDWVDKYAADFRVLIEENPEWLELYGKSPEALENLILQQLQKKKRTIH